MRILVPILALTLATPLVAQTARVTSGEHADFTRLVVEFPAAADWRLGRTDQGYELALTGPAQPRYDLTTVWDRIPRTRLRAIWADPEDGALELSLGCSCHAFPFELRPGTVVIDLREGPAPPGSVFERSLAGSPVAALANRLADLPAPSAGYDWLTLAAPEPEAPALPLPLATGAVSLAPLRDALLVEISRGAAEGVVDMTLSRGPAHPAGDRTTGLPWAQIIIGEMPGVMAGDAVPATGDMQADGAACIPDESLAVADWGGDGPVAAQIADARAGLMGELDLPDAAAVKRAVRHHLYLGFGAEALQYVALIDAAPQDPDPAIHAGLARIIDGMEDPSSPFVRMLGCDGAASLWSALLYARLPAGPEVNVAAVLRSFAALPPHLRQHLGPRLADRFLDAGNPEAARMVRDATARVTGIAAREVALLDAKGELSAGRLDAAEIHAEAALAGGGTSGLEAVLTLVEARFRKLSPVEPELLATVSSYLAEVAGTAADPGLRRAHVLALGLAGRPRDAMAALATAPEAEPDLWQVIGARATDADLMDLAVPAAGPPRPVVAEETALAIATRLVDLGFADAALGWLGPLAPDAGSAARLLAARAELARGDARAARDLSAGLDDPAAHRVAADALVRLDAIRPAAAAWRAAGAPEAAERLTTWTRDWAEVAITGPAPWREAAALVAADGSTAGEDGLLAQGTALVEDSLRARDTIRALLAAVPDPSAPVEIR